MCSCHCPSFTVSQQATYVEFGALLVPYSMDMSSPQPTDTRDCGTPQAPGQKTKVRLSGARHCQAPPKACGARRSAQMLPRFHNHGTTDGTLVRLRGNTRPQGLLLLAHIPFFTVISCSISTTSGIPCSSTAPSPRQTFRSQIGLLCHLTTLTSETQAVPSLQAQAAPSRISIALHTRFALTACDGRARIHRNSHQKK